MLVLDTSAILASSYVVERIELRGWPVLGRDLALELDDTCTVLVGRNASGKSLILEGLSQGARNVITLSTEGSWGFAVTLRFGGFEERLTYEYAVASAGDVSQEAAELRPFIVHEKCEWVGPNSTDLVWIINLGDGIVRGRSDIVPAGVAFPAIGQVEKRRVPEAYFLFKLMRAVRRVSAGVPRDRIQRRENFVLRGSPYRAPGDRRVGQLALTIDRWHQSDESQFKEFVDLARRVGLLRELSVETLTSAQRPTGNELLDVQIDGVNIGLLSDGTLRVLETLVALLDSKVLLLEEPETGIHPGLLTKLLAVLESYSADRQIVISTHSPIIVSWAKPHQIRLVERQENVTTVRKLDQDQIETACRHLDESTLGEFVYGGGVDA